jgi:hypothetical protein
MFNKFQWRPPPPLWLRPDELLCELECECPPLADELDDRIVFDTVVYRNVSVFAANSRLPGKM